MPRESNQKEAMYLETVPEENQQKETKQKRKGKIAKVYALHQKGKTVKEIAEKIGISERVVRAYVWRKQHPEKYAELLKRYFAKKKIKAAADEQKKKED